MDELLINAFIRMVGEKVISLKRLPNGYCGDDSKSCTICAERPWWEIEFVNVGPIVIGWRKRVINIDWSKTGRKLDPDKITESDTTKEPTYIHAWSYGDAINYTRSIVTLLRMQKWDEEREKAAKVGQ